ncbi:MAG: hypothetical protein LBH98_02045 [Chitinispirillales bacterium]|nr:hypothetical protein [Chitinispirillales bacterium]
MKIIVIITIVVTSIFSHENEFNFESNISVYRAITDSKSEFEFNNKDSNSIDSLNAKIDYYNDSETKKQSSLFSFNGKKTTNNEKFNIGGEWNIPVFVYRYSLDGNDNGYDATAVSIGFTAESASKNFPFGFSLGPAFEGGLNRNTAHNAIDLQNEKIWGGGGYFSIFGGDSLGGQIAQTPLLFDGNIMGRYINSDKNHRNAVSKAKLTYEKNGFFKTDSLILSISDTIVLGEINSRFGYLNGFRTVEIPDKYGNNLNVLLRATKIGEAFFEPSFEISVNNNRYRYLNTDKFYGSLKKSAVSVLGFVDKDFGNWNFETGLRISGAKEENCYLSNINSKSTGIDTLNEKLKDANVFNPMYYLSSQYISPKEIVHLLAEYTIERHKRVYPFSYNSNGILMKANDDFDNVSNQTKIQCDLHLTQIYDLYFSAEMLKYQIYFLKPQMSAASRSERRYAFELGNMFTIDTSVIFSLKGNISAAPQKYRFAGDGNTPLPYHNRNFSFNSDLSLQYSNGWSNYLYFSLGRFDRGIIYNEEYYGVEDKKYEIISNISLSKSTSFLMMSSGIEVKRMKSYNFIYSQNDYESRGVSYLLSPFISGNAVIKKDFFLDFYIKRNINKGILSSKDFWDLSVSLVWNR